MIGNYKILKEIGEGGFGKTYLALHTILNKKVVIKQSLYKSVDAQKILLNEASVLFDLNHWALPTVKDVITDDENNLLLIMSYIEGAELNQYVTENGPLETETVCWITQRILSALYYLHYNGIIHRDIKPANIIVNFNTHIATLVDFGLSKLKPDCRIDISGYTPYFSSPEQIQGKAPIPESDIYSLGMSMLFLLGGDIKTKKIPENVNIFLREFIENMITENPLKRPNDCKKLNDELSEIREKIFNRKHTC